MAKKKLIVDSDVEKSKSESIYESESKELKKVSVVRSKKKQEQKSNKNSAKKNNSNTKSSHKNKAKKSVKNSSNKKSNKDDSEDEEINDLEEKILPGQKYPTPPKGDPVRAFYESMLKQKPNSIMALKHCLEFGCLNRHEAESAIKKLNKIKK